MSGNLTNITNKITTKEKNAISDYVSSGNIWDDYLYGEYGTANKKLIQSHINNIQSAIYKSETTKDITVYRGIGGLTGQARINDSLFFSSSTDPNVTLAFIPRVTNAAALGAMYKFVVPKGSNMLEINKFTKQYGYQKEVIFPKGTSLTELSRAMINVTYKGNKYTIPQITAMINIPTNSGFMPYPYAGK